MITQPELDFKSETAQDLRDKGIQQALDHADHVNEKWSERAYEFAKDYLKFHQVFMAEELRKSSEGFIPDPPSKRAYGGIISRLAREGKITLIGYAKTSNPLSHKTPAARWKSNICHV